MGTWVEDPSWRREFAGITQARQDQVTVAVLDDMRAGVPVDTGALLGSLDWERVDDHTTRAGSRDKDYSVWVEDGHEIVLPGGVRTGKIVPPQPYMRPALFRERSL